MAEKTMVAVTNRSRGVTVFKLKDFKDRPLVRREFKAGQTQQIDFEELEALMYTAGGDVLLRDYLLVQDPDTRRKLNLDTEVEYNMSEQDVIKILKEGSTDSFLDCLDYAPQGVLDLIRHHAVELPVGDMRKIEAINRRMNIDVLRIIQNKKLAEATDSEEATAAKPHAASTPSGRRVAVTEASSKTLPTYNVVTPAT